MHTLKRCETCKEAKPLDSFSKDRRRKGGLRGQCKACVKIYRAKYYAENTEALKAYNAKYYAENAQAINARSAKWRAENPDKASAAWARRRAAKLERTPAWANQADIEAVYASRVRMQECLGIEMHVDHIVPLRGKDVSGLHVAHNLQVIPAFENIRKNNKHEV